MIELSSGHAELTRKCFDLLMTRGVPSEYNVGKVSCRLDGILVECEDNHLRVYSGMDSVFEVELTSSCGVVKCNNYKPGLWEKFF